MDLPLREQAASWLKNPSQTWTFWKRARRRRKRQKWDAMGATALKVALRDTTLVDAAWLVELAATEGGIVPRCQDVPKHAKVSLKEMEKWPGFHPAWPCWSSHSARLLALLDAPHAFACSFMCYAVRLCCCARAAADSAVCGRLSLPLSQPVARAGPPRPARRAAPPDRLCAQDLCREGAQDERLSGGRLLGLLLAASEEPGGVDDRTKKEKAQFKRALNGINAWYGHPMTYVLLVNTPLPTGTRTPTRSLTKVEDGV